MRVFVIARKITTTITRADGVAALNTLDTALTTEFSDGGDHGVGATTVYTQWEAKDSDDYLSAVVVCAQTDVPTVIATFRGTIQAGLEAQATISAVALTDIAFLAQSDTDEMNHEFLAGLLGGASSDHQHLTTAALASVSALGSASALTAGTGVGEVPVVTNAGAHGVAVRHMGPGPAVYVGKADPHASYGAVHTDGNFVYLGCSGGLLSYSYTPAGALSLLDTEVAPGIVTSITSAGEYIVAGDSAGDIWVFTVDAAGALTQVGGATGGAGVVEGLCWDGKHLFAARMATGVISYTLSEAGALAVVDTYNPAGNCYDVLMLENGVLCIAGDTGGMYTVTVSEVGVMTAADSDSFGANSARGLATDGTFVYMAYALAGVGSYSITAAGAITRHALDNPGKPTCVCSDGRRIWVGSNAGGVAVYDVNADGTLIQGPIDATENFVDAVASCGILLFAASTNGLCVYRAGPGYYAEEHLTGEFWTDGRPIYRQIAYFGAGPNAGAVSVAVDHGATFHEVIACTLCADDGGGAGARLVRADGFADIDSYVNAGDGKLYLEAPGNHAGDAFSVILEYTLD